MSAAGCVRDLQKRQQQQVKQQQVKQQRVKPPPPPPPQQQQGKPLQQQQQQVKQEVKATVQRTMQGQPAQSLQSRRSSSTAVRGRQLA
jgi:hypothetical protein